MEVIAGGLGDVALGCARSLGSNLAKSRKGRRLISNAVPGEPLRSRFCTAVSVRSVQHSLACSLTHERGAPLQDTASLSGRPGGIRRWRRRRGVAAQAAAEGKVGFFGKLGRLLQEKAKSDIDRIFSGTSKARENMAVVEELLTYWNLGDAENIMDELEDALLVADFGPRTTAKILDPIRADIAAGKLKLGPEIRERIKDNILKILTIKDKSTELQLGTRSPAVIMICGVNGGGKTTTVGKLAHKLMESDMKVLLAAGDTFRAAASEQLEVWAERAGASIVTMEGGNKDPATVLSRAVNKAKAEEYDVVLADTSGRLHTNYGLMEELKSCKKAIYKAHKGAPNEILLVLDGTTGLNMLPQAKEFNQCVGVTGFVLTKMDGTSRGGCVVSVVDALGIPVKFMGVGETIEDLQPFDPRAFVDGLLPSK